MAARALAAGDHGAITEGMDCSACHTSDGWKLASGAGEGFDHSRTGFPLLGGHRATACTACHDGRTDLPTACVGCHSTTTRTRGGSAQPARSATPA